MAKTTKAPEIKPPASTVNVEVLANHYQKTFEISYDYWKERNKLFVALVITASVGLMLVLQVPEADSLLIYAIAKLLGITDTATIAELNTTFPFEILLSAILVALFYLMQKLYSTNLSVLRSFQYLGAMETDIRKIADLPADSISFTREGKNYWKKRLFMQRWSKATYVLVLLVILIPFIILKLNADCQSGNTWIFVIDVIVSLLTVAYLAEYAYFSFVLDAPMTVPTTMVKETPPPNNKPARKTKRT